MNLQDAIKFIIQTGHDISTENGIQSDGALSIGLDTLHGLLSMARGRSGDAAIAEKTLEILIDDMQLNLPTLQQKRGSKSPEILCLQESLENINEYLLVYAHERGLADTQWGVSLCAFQFSPSNVSCCVYGDFQAYHFREGQINALFTQEMNNHLLGRDTAFQAEACEQTLQKGDVLAMISRDAMTALGNEFLRLTMSRFSDNLEMAQRQINARAQHEGLPSKPEFILLRVDQVESARKWLGGLIKR